jgi:hypothetical protein
VVVALVRGVALPFLVTTRAVAQGEALVLTAG